MSRVRRRACRRRTAFAPTPEGKGKGKQGSGQSAREGLQGFKGDEDMLAEFVEATEGEGMLDELVDAPLEAEGMIDELMEATEGEELVDAPLEGEGMLDEPGESTGGRGR